MAYLIGFILSLLIASIAFYKKSLSLSGFFAAMILGTLIYAWGTHVMFMILMSFFISSSLLTKLGDSDKEKQGRNWIQVLANGCSALVFSFLYMMTNETNDTYLLIAVMAISVSNADTWASEIGKLSKKENVSITTFKPISKNESGGVTWLGMSASFLGALWISFIYVLFIGTMTQFDVSLLIHAIYIIIAGFAGSVLDSYLGIWIQEKYQHPSTLDVTENRNHDDTYHLLSGIKYINNDMVNLITSILVVIVASLLLR